MTGRGICEGDELELARIAPGQYRLVKVERRNAGLVDRLLACPDRDWFVPLATLNERDFAHARVRLVVPGR